ncbi:MAG: hypothetical protein MZW92_03115 [Comamonadaceae bacterium]|nr:hypothetical protein [Comamonadaceae bacterium]
MPLTYRKSLQDPRCGPRAFQFYDINYAVFPAGLRLADLRGPADGPSSWRGSRRPRRCSRRTGTDIADATRAARSGRSSQEDASKAALAAGRNGDALREPQARARRRAPDRAGGRPSPGRSATSSCAPTGTAPRSRPIDCPVGDLFGYSFGDPAVAIAAARDGGRRHELHLFPDALRAVGADRAGLGAERRRPSDRTSRPEIVTVPVGKGPDEGPVLRPCGAARTRASTGRALHLSEDDAAAGHVVGVILQAQGLESGNTRLLRGRRPGRHRRRAGRARARARRTSFNGGWYDVPGRWETRTSLPLSGCLDYKKPLARTGGYRLFLTDSYAYREVDRLHDRARAGGQRRADRLRERRLLLRPGPAGGLGAVAAGRRPAARDRSRPHRLRPRLERAHPHDVASRTPCSTKAWSTVGERAGAPSSR